MNFVENVCKNVHDYLILKNQTDVYCDVVVVVVGIGFDCDADCDCDCDCDEHDGMNFDFDSKNYGGGPNDERKKKDFIDICSQTNPLR